MATHAQKNADHFSGVAATWDEKPHVVEVAEAISQKLSEKLQLQGKVLLDLGAGTGLVAQRLASKAQQVVGVDVSAEMVKVLNAKRAQHANIVGLCVDLADEDAFRAATADAQVPDQYDVALTHLTLHHIEDVAATLKRLADVTKPGGYVAVSDILKTEQSHAFHGPRAHGSAHHTVAHAGGFEPSLIMQLMQNAGLANVDITPDAATMLREHEKDGEKVSSRHPIFLALAQKQ